MHPQTVEGSGGNPTPFNFTLIPPHKPEDLLENVRSAVARGLPEVRECTPHDLPLSIAGGGPSLADTWKDLDGCIAAVNGSLGYLLEKGVKPSLCGVCHPTIDVLDAITAHPDVVYFIASHVHPAVFDKLKGCRVFLWHNHPIDGLDDLLNELYPKRDWIQVPGGCTMGLRWIQLGYLNGFRKFRLHGFDSSFRETTHAYPDRQDAKEWITFDGYKTRLNFLGQVTDFERTMVELGGRGIDDVDVQVFGDGLLQSRHRYWEAKNPPFIWPDSDIQGRQFILREVRAMNDFLKYIPKREVVVQAGGNVGVYPRRLGDGFRKVYTFEPEPDNFACLLQNIRHYPNITADNAALGDRYTHVITASHQTGNSGAVHVVELDDDTTEHFDEDWDGRIPMRTVDEMGLDHCDLIWLDIEGFEELALKGAEKTVEKFHPAIIIEEKAILAEMHGLKPSGAVDWLKERHYYRVTKFGNDALFVYGGP